MCVRVLPVVLMIGILSLPVAVGGPASPTAPPEASDDNECSIAVCAESLAAISASCTQGVDPYTGDGFVACTLRFVATATGSSPVFLPGDVAGSAKAQVDWSCTPGFCNAKRIRESLDFDTYWDGGPDVPEAGLASGASRSVEVARVTIHITASAGTVGPCLSYDATLENAVTARVPRLDPSLPAATLDEAHASAEAQRHGSACFE